MEIEKRVEFICDKINSEVKVIIQVVSHESFAGLSFSLGSRCKEQGKCNVKPCPFIKHEEEIMIEKMKQDYEITKALREKEKEWKF